MKTLKPDLQTVLSRRRRSDRQYFEEKLVLGMTKEQIVEECENTYSLSVESLKILDTLVELEAATKKSKAKIVTEAPVSLNTTTETQEETLEENDSSEEESLQPKPSAHKKTKQPKPQNADSE